MVFETRGVSILLKNGNEFWYMSVFTIYHPELSRLPGCSTPGNSMGEVFFQNEKFINAGRNLRYCTDTRTM